MRTGSGAIPEIPRLLHGMGGTWVFRELCAEPDSFPIYFRDLCVAGLKPPRSLVYFVLCRASTAELRCPSPMCRRFRVAQQRAVAAEPQTLCLKFVPILSICLLRVALCKLQLAVDPEERSYMCSSQCAWCNAICAAFCDSTTLRAGENTCIVTYWLKIARGLLQNSALRSGIKNACEYELKVLARPSPRKKRHRPSLVKSVFCWLFEVQGLKHVVTSS